MALFDNRLFNWLRPKPPSRARPLPVSARARQTQNDASGSVPFSFDLPPAGDTYDYWRVDLTDPDDLAALPVDQIQKILARVSPEINKAWWDFVIFVGNMMEIKAYRGDEVDKVAQAAIDDFIALLDDQQNSVMNAVHRIISGGFMRGAFAAELVIDNDGNAPIDLAAPDPQSFRFQQVNDSERGEVWELGQWQDGRWVSFRNVPTIKYVPLVPQVGSPYAVSWMEAAVFPGLFLIMLLQDVRRVIANFGYPREDIMLDLERLRAAMPADVMADPQRVQEWINDTIDEIIDVVEALQPGDAWVHTDVTTRQELKGAIGGQGANFAPQVDQMIQSLERMLIRGLKTIPFLLASRQSTTERQADREWEAFTTGIDIVQRKLKFLLDRLFTLALEVQGIQADVSVEFADIGAFDALRDAQVRAAEIANAVSARDQGWITQDQASEAITGSTAVGPPPPPVTAVPQLNTELLAEIRRARGDVAAAVLGLDKRNENGHKRNGQIDFTR